MLNFWVELTLLAHGLLRTQEASKTPYLPVKRTAEWTYYVVVSKGADNSKPTLLRFGMQFLVRVLSEKNTQRVRNLSLHTNIGILKILIVYGIQHRRA